MLTFNAGARYLLNLASELFKTNSSTVMGFFKTKGKNPSGYCLANNE